MWNTNGKLFFFSKRCFPWKQSCGHLKCSSDRPTNKISRKHGKKMPYIRLQKPGSKCSSDYLAGTNLPKPSRNSA